jgi:predicted transcriptional regulator
MEAFSDPVFTGAEVKASDVQELVATLALGRTALANYFAAPVLMPYRLFRDAAESTRYDVEVLKSRFGVSFEQVCHRLTTLRRAGAEGVPFHFIRVDIAGNISKRFSASGIHIARFGAACPRWNVYDAFGTPGMVRVQLSRMPDGGTFFCIARTTGHTNTFTTGGLPHRIGQRAVGLGCDVRHATRLIYADGLNLGDPQLITPIGVSCRTCPRTDCAERAMPSLHSVCTSTRTSAAPLPTSRPEAALIQLPLRGAVRQRVFHAPM